MPKNVGVIIFGIISIIALGLGGYTFIATQMLAKPEQKLVGVWDEVDENTDYAPFNTSDNWLVEVSEEKYIDVNYITLSNTGTRFTLTKSGIYRFQMTFLLSSIATGNQYWIDLLKNGVHDFYLDYHTTTSSTIYHEVHAEGYVTSDGDDYIEINARASSGDAFTIYTHATLDFNQFSLEFMSN